MKNQKNISSVCLYCNKPTEWIDLYCQEHWEFECSRTWWEMVMLRGGLKIKARSNSEQ